jgi:hypothetical protein
MQSAARTPAHYDTVVEDKTPADRSAAAATVAPYAEAGATWWLDSYWELGGHDEVLARVKAGPPRSG